MDLRKPWGISPVLFGLIQFWWVILFVLLSMIASGSVVDWVTLSLLPSIVLAGYELIRKLKWGWLIQALSYSAQSLQMITLSRPSYRTIFGYYRREFAPSFDIYRGFSGGFELEFHADGCPNADADLLSTLQRELPEWSVGVRSKYPLVFTLKKLSVGGKKLNNDDFISNC
ncbi:MAG: hypothetical protein LKF01_03370 [Lactobacillus sp.]|nr:hypothetical protein [Lactobacillus sp.]MCI1330334.1 hypothetical protein [Lactobacillus sp.]